VSDAEWNGGVDLHRGSCRKQAAIGWSGAAIAGGGLEGDRYALKTGTFYKPEPDYELTLIEAEAIEALQRDYQIELLRRTLVAIL